MDRFQSCVESETSWDCRTQREGIRGQRVGIRGQRVGIRGQRMDGVSEPDSDSNCLTYEI